jgi:HPt (histidine-containing phosphotransfer) domain-containing protein
MTTPDSLPQGSGLGKYRDLVVAIALFLVLDLGVLVFNFLASQELELDASRINRAGELRMLTQQMTKALLTFQIEKAGGLPTQTSSAQLTEAHARFGAALDYLGRQEFADRGAMARLFEAEDAREFVEGLRHEWAPLDDAIRPVVATPDPEAGDIEIAASKAVVRNIKMANLADDLAAAVEKSALEKAGRMRQIQMAGIALALLNFIFIVLKFVRSLRRSDRVADEARRDTADILDNVKEGLLLVHADGTVGGRFSRSIATLLGRAPEPGEDFRALMNELVAAQLREPLSDYLDLLFKPDVKPALLESLNPLHEAPVRPAGAAQDAPRYLTFQFSPIREAGRVQELLVTVFDVTAKVELERELAGTRERARSEMEDLLAVLDKDAALVERFLDGAAGKLADANGALKDVRPRQEAYEALVATLLATVHGIKGEAAMLDVATVSGRAHAVEDVLAKLRGKARLGGDDFIPVAVEIAQLGHAIERVLRVVARVRRFSTPQALANPVEALLAPLAGLAERAAADLGRKVRFEYFVPHIAHVPEPLALLLREAVPQLVRNAVAHGIEPPDERLRAGKDPMGTLRLEITGQPDGRHVISLRDDGRGLSPEEIRTRLVAKGLRTRDVVDTMSDTQVLSAIFDDGYSGADSVNVHAGRGVGLCVVRDLVSRLGAKLRIATTPRSSTQFILQV